MKYILWKKLKTTQKNVFESEDIEKVIEFCKEKGLSYHGLSYVGGFYLFSDGKHTYSIQGQVNGIVCGYNSKINPMIIYSKGSSEIIS